MRLNLCKLLSKLGIALMVFIALAIQPMQMTMASAAVNAINAAKAEAAQNAPKTQVSKTNGASPQVVCNPQTTIGTNAKPGFTASYVPPPNCPASGSCCPTSPTPTPAPARLAGYYLSHGIGDTTNLSSTTSSGYFGSVLPNFLNSDGSSSNVMIQTPAVDWKNKTIPNQAVDLGNLIQGSQANVQNIVLIGHSQGGLRSREYVQHLNGQYASSGASKVIGLVTIGSPNYGAPIVNNAYSVVGFLSLTAGAALSFFSGYTATAFTGGAYEAAKAVLNNLIGAGGPNMAPGSPFLASINTPGASGFAPIPSNIATLEVRGNNNEIDALVGSSQADTRAKRQDAATAFTILAGASWAVAWFFGLSIPAAIAFTAIAALLWGLPAFWRTFVVGSNEGDGVVPYTNQVIRQNNVNIGGSSYQRQTNLPSGTHIGPTRELEDPATRDGLSLFLNGISMPCKTCNIH